MTDSLVTYASEYPPVRGGVSTLIDEVTHHLASEWSPVTLVLADTSTVEASRSHAAERNVEFVHVPLYKKDLAKPWWYLAFPIYLLSYLLQAWRVARATKANRIFAGYWFPDGYIARLVANRLGIDYYVGTYGLDIIRSSSNARQRKRMTKVLSGAAKVFCVSNFTAEKVISLGVPAERTVVIGGGVDTDMFYPSDEGKKVRETHNLGVRPTLFTLGRLVERKGHALVLRALADIVKEIPDVIYLIGGDGPEMANLVALKDSLQLQENVIFLGRVPAEELRAHYNACDIFVMPNQIGPNPWDVEGFGIVFLEAAACGKPAIGGHCGGASDAVVDGQTGYLVPEKNVEALTERLLHLLADKGLQARLGQAGLDRARREFTWEHIAGLYAHEMDLDNRRMDDSVVSTG